MPRETVPTTSDARRQSVDRRHDHGPFDIVGDIHGCSAELDDLLLSLGYDRDGGAWRSAAGRTAIFVGDYIDRGPDPAGTLQRVMAMVAAGRALAVPGNHDIRLQQRLESRFAPLMFGLAETVAALKLEPREFRRDVRQFLQALPSHYLCDAGRLVVAHAGLPEVFQGRESADARRFAANGVPADEIDQGDARRRHAWVDEYSGAAAVVYGHTPVFEPVWNRNTIDIDTGCVYGGRLTALRWPERTLVSVPAHEAYAVPPRAFVYSPR